MIPPAEGLLIKSVTSWPSTQVSEKLLVVGVQLFQLFGTGRSGDAQEDQDRTIQPTILVGEAADTPGDLHLRNGRDLIHHQSADGAQTVGLTPLDRQSKQSRI